MRSIFRIPSDNMAGDAGRRVPIPYYTRRCGMVLSALSYLIIPIYTLLFVRGTDWFSSNFSVIGSLEEQKRAFAAWGILISCTLYRMLFPLIEQAPFSRGKLRSTKKRRICFVLLNLALLFLTAAIILPYVPSRFPLQAWLHIVFAFFSAVSLFLCLVFLIHGYYRNRPALFRTPLQLLWSSFAVSLILLLVSGIVNSALEILVTITACVLTRQMYRKVFGV